VAYWEMNIGPISLDDVMTEHTLIWRWAAASNANSMLGWVEHVRSGSQPFRKQPASGQIGGLAAMAACQAIAFGRDVTIAWGGADPTTTSYDELESAWWKLTPKTVFCRERSTGNRWIASDGTSKPEGMPEAAVQEAINSLVAQLYPRWDHHAKWRPHALLIRHNVSGEQLGLVESLPLVGDQILLAIRDDPEVHEAFMREDPAFPLTVYDLAKARLRAQDRMGIPEDKRVVMFSSEIDGLLTPYLMRAGKGDSAAILAILRRRLQHYRELADFVLMSALREYSHSFPHLEALREAAKASPASAPAAA
jgi:hypothetical protein